MLPPEKTHQFLVVSAWWARHDWRRDGGLHNFAKFLLARSALGFLHQEGYVHHSKDVHVSLTSEEFNDLLTAVDEEIDMTRDLINDPVVKDEDKLTEIPWFARLYTLRQKIVAFGKKAAS